VALVKNRRFGGTYLLHYQGEENQRVWNVIIFILMMEAIRYSETSVLTSSILRYIPEDGILHSHRRENLQSYIALTGWAV
jgi:hypothetical protein